MKKLIIPSLIMLFLLLQDVTAQDYHLQRAKFFFDKTHYAEAINLYEKIVSKKITQEAVKNLADSYYYSNDFAKAQQYYQILIANYSQDIHRQYYFRYAQTLKATNFFQDGNENLRAYYAKSSNPDELVKFEKDCKTLKNISAIGNRYEIKNLELNSDKSEFSAVLHNQDLIFSGVKKKRNIFSKVYKWNNEGYLSLMSIPANAVNLKNVSRKKFASELRTSLHQSNAVFTKDGLRVYYTRNYSRTNGGNKNKNKVSNLQIVTATLVNGKWTKISALPFNNVNYSVEHPALSPDDKILYFASDMPGTLGSFDIFSVKINNGSFGIPQNVGTDINTDKREQFPFIDNDNNLYFSSDGHLGFGGLDIFVATLSSDQYSSVNNAGLPLNSNADDFAFNINSTTKEGYFSSNRLGGKGADDIYHLKEIKDLVIVDCEQLLSGIAIDEDTSLPLQNATVRCQVSNGLFNNNTITTAVDGKFNFTVACESIYTVMADKTNYISTTKQLNTNGQRNHTNNIILKLKSNEFVKQNAEKQAEESKQKELANSIALKTAAIKKKEDEIIQAELRKKEKIKAIIAVEKDIVFENKKLIIKTKPIYFDYNLWYIRQESKPILDRVLELMMKYPNMNIEIGSHTDARGDHKFNAALSTNRANSTKAYLLKGGISKKRINAVGYGEKNPVVKCATDSSCTEEEHEFNRRSEFVIKNLF